MRQNDSRRYGNRAAKPDYRGRNNREERENQTSSEQEDQSWMEGILEGRNAVTEALRSGRTIDKVFIADGDTDRSLARLAAQDKEAGEVFFWFFVF